MKPALLFLCHRIPYPPNKGDKIRSFHLLRYLAKHYRVYLGAFIDDPADRQYMKDLDEWCEVNRFFTLNPVTARIKSLQGLVTGQPLTLPYYFNHEMAEWVDDLFVREKIASVLVFSSAMAQFVLDDRYAGARRVVDFVDIDSDKWLQYAQKKSWPMSWVYRREGKQLLDFERRVAGSFDRSLFVSSKEAAMFKQLAPSVADRVDYYNNGVDIEAFSPELDLANPYPEGGPVILFTGAMDYWPNDDAVHWFATEVLPLVRQDYADVRFYIVGSHPTERVSALSRLDGITVTGRVPDVQPYIKFSTVVVAPMHIARGVQNKVLEGMAMAKPVIVTSKGLEGIEAVDGSEVLVADNAVQFARKVADTIKSGGEAIGIAARQRVCSDFTWEHNLPRVDLALSIDNGDNSP